MRAAPRAGPGPFAGLLLAALLAPAVGQAEPAALRARAEQRAATLGSLREAAAARLAELHKVLVEPGGSVLAALDAVASRLEATEFASALEAVATAIEALPATGPGGPASPASAFDPLRDALMAGDRAKHQQEWLLLLADRLERCQQAVAAGQADLGALLRELDEALREGKRWRALERSELATLRAFEAEHRAAQSERRDGELREQAKTELQSLEQDFPGLARRFGAADGDRDSAFAQFDAVAGSVRDALCQLPDGDPVRTDLQQRLAALDTPAREAFTKAYGDAASARIQPVLDYHTHEHDGWRDEAGQLTAEQYLQFDCMAAMLGRPRTGALAHRATLWLAFVATDPECQRAAAHAPIAALVATVRKDRDTAVARLVTVAEALVAELERNGLADDTQRQRAGVLADNDLRVTLQEHAAQWPLIARVHHLTDAYDLKALGEPAARARIRAAEQTVVDLQWPRMGEAVALAPGFTPAMASRYEGLTVRLAAGRDCADEFAPGGHDRVFRIDGQLFAASFEPSLQQWLATATARTRRPLDGASEHEVLAVVGKPGTLGLLAADPKAEAVQVPCRQLRVIGLRADLVAFLVR